MGCIFLAPVIGLLVEHLAEHPCLQHVWALKKCMCKHVDVYAPCRSFFGVVSSAFCFLFLFVAASVFLGASCPSCPAPASSSSLLPFSSSFCDSFFLRFAGAVSPASPSSLFFFWGFFTFAFGQVVTSSAAFGSFTSLSPSWLASSKSSSKLLAQEAFAFALARPRPRPRPFPLPRPFLPSDDSSSSLMNLSMSSASASSSLTACLIAFWAWFDNGPTWWRLF